MNKPAFSPQTKAIIVDGVKRAGSYDSVAVLDTIGHLIPTKSGMMLKPFLDWVVKNKKTFGHGNFEAVYAEFRNQGRQPLPDSELPDVLKSKTPNAAKQVRSKTNARKSCASVQRRGVGLAGRK